jgi:sucrose phosphorylase
MEDIEDGLRKDIVIKQLELLRFRNECHAFWDDTQFVATMDRDKAVLSWGKDEIRARLIIEAKTLDFVVKVIKDNAEEVIMQSLTPS